MIKLEINKKLKRSNSLWPWIPSLLKDVSNLIDTNLTSLLKLKYESAIKACDRLLIITYIVGTIEEKQFLCQFNWPRLIQKLEKKNQNFDETSLANQVFNSIINFNYLT